MNLHFEELWEKGEESCDKDSSPEEVLKEISIKLDLLKTISSSQLSGSDRAKSLSLAFGSLLKSFCHLSMIENINVYAALLESLKE